MGGTYKIVTYIFDVPPLKTMPKGVVIMRPSPTSRSRVHATFVWRVHATPRPLKRFPYNGSKGTRGIFVQGFFWKPTHKHSVQRILESLNLKVIHKIYEEPLYLAPETGALRRQKQTFRWGQSDTPFARDSAAKTNIEILEGTLGWDCRWKTHSRLCEPSNKPSLNSFSKNPLAWTRCLGICTHTQKNRINGTSSRRAKSTRRQVNRGHTAEHSKAASTWSQSRSHMSTRLCFARHTVRKGNVSQETPGSRCD